MMAYKRCRSRETRPAAIIASARGTGRFRIRTPARGLAAKSSRQETQGADGGGTRRFVACSKAYASSMRRGSAHDIAVKLTPYGAGRALYPPGNGGVAAFGTKPNGTMTVG